MSRRSLAVLPLAAALVLGGCQSQWLLESDRPDRITTNLLVRSEPNGAAITFNGTALDRAPLKLPVEYDHAEQRWARQTNRGAQLRDSWGTLGSVIGFPVWMIASFFHTSERRSLHNYGQNEHVVGARLPGYKDAYRELTLEGQDELEVTLTLEAR